MSITVPLVGTHVLAIAPLPAARSRANALATLVVPTATQPRIIAMYHTTAAPVAGNVQNIVQYRAAQLTGNALDILKRRIQTRLRVKLVITAPLVGGHVRTVRMGAPR